MKALLLSALLVALCGCGCTSSYPVSFLTLGIGYQYCSGNWMGEHRCLKPEGRQEKGCHCSQDCACKKAKAIAGAPPSVGCSCCGGD